MKMTKYISLILLLFTGLMANSKHHLTKQEKDLAQQWKMWKIEEAGKEVDPNISRFMLNLHKNKTFTIIEHSEIAHRGTWEYSDKTLILHDKVTNKDMVYPVTTLDHTHLVLVGVETESRKTFLTPLTHKDAVHLSHKEHLMAKTWTIYAASDTNRIGAIYDFHEDKTFDYLLHGHTVPVSEGTWELAKDEKTIILSLRKSEKVVLDVVEFHRHELTIVSKSSGVKMSMHDAYLHHLDQQTKASGLPALKEGITK
jgi:hypothetical protein